MKSFNSIFEKYNNDAYKFRQKQGNIYLELYKFTDRK